MAVFCSIFPGWFGVRHHGGRLGDVRPESVSLMGEMDEVVVLEDAEHPMPLGRGD